MSRIEDILAEPEENLQKQWLESAYNTVETARIIKDWDDIEPDMARSQIYSLTWDLKDFLKKAGLDPESDESLREAKIDSGELQCLLHHYQNIVANHEIRLALQVLTHHIKENLPNFSADQDIASVTQQTSQALGRLQEHLNMK